MPNKKKRTQNKRTREIIRNKQRKCHRLRNTYTHLQTQIDNAKIQKIIEVMTETNDDF